MMNAKFLIFCLAVMLMVAADTAEAYRKREWGETNQDEDHYDITGGELNEFRKALDALEAIYKAVQTDWGQDK